eukprot:538628-Alexandrium_andersonii.AAC.1
MRTSPRASRVRAALSVITVPRAPRMRWRSAARCRRAPAGLPRRAPRGRRSPGAAADRGLGAFAEGLFGRWPRAA